MTDRHLQRRRVLRDTGLRELRWISQVLFWLLLAFGIVDALTHPDDGSWRWRMASSLIPAAVAGFAFLITRRREQCEWCGVLVAVPILTLQASIVYTAWITGEQASLGYMIVVITLLGALAISSVEYVVSQVIAVCMIAVAVALLWNRDNAGMPTWIAVVAVAVAGATNLHLARRSGLRHLADAQGSLEQEANEDRLTGLTSRRGIDRAFPELREQARRLGSPVFAMFIDVDGLKQVNDTAGHDVGDAVIDAAAAALRQHCRGTDLLCRWGGDEFVVLGIGTGPDPSRFELIVTDYLTTTNPAQGAWLGHLSVGHAQSSAADAELLVLLGRADADMYARRQERRRLADAATRTE